MLTERSTEWLPAGTPSAWSLRSRHSPRQRSGAGDRGRWKNMKTNIARFFIILGISFLASCASPKVLKLPNMQNVQIGSHRDLVVASAGYPHEVESINDGPRKSSILWIYEWDKKGDDILNQMFTYVYLKNGRVTAIQQDPLDKFERDTALRNGAIARTNEIKSYYRQLNSAKFRAGADNFVAGMAAGSQALASSPYTQQPQAVMPVTSSSPIASSNRYSQNSLSNPYGAGSPYKADGLMNPYSQYGSPYSNQSWRNPYATDAPKLYDSQGNYRGRLSSNPYDSESTSNPYGKYGSPYSSESINNPYGAGSPYSTQPIYVVPQ